MDNITFNPNVHFLGVICYRQHDWKGTGQTLRYIGNRQCLLCKKIWKREYRKQPKVKEYTQKYNQLYQREYRKKNKEILALKKKQYAQANQDKIKAKGIKYRKENAEAIKQKKREYYQKNSAKIKIKCRQYAIQNPELTRLRQQRYYSSPKGKAAGIRNTTKRKAILLGCHHVDWSREQIVNKFNGECAYCCGKEQLTVDHFIPLSLGGTDCDSNLLPACGSCNFRKNDSDPLVWFEQQPFYSTARWKQILVCVGQTQGGLPSTAFVLKLNNRTQV